MIQNTINKVCVRNVRTPFAFQKRGVTSWIGEAITGAANVSSTAMTNHANYAIAQETNKANREIAQETNEANIAMNQANNDLQIQLQNEMNEYNSLQSQLSRAHDAGVNPNAVLGGNVSGNLQTSLPATQAGHVETGAPMQTPAPMQSPMQGISDALDSYFKHQEEQQRAKLAGEQARNQEIINQFQAQLSAGDVQVKEATVKQLLASADANLANVRALNKTVDKMNKEIDKMDKEIVLLGIDAYWRDDMYYQQLDTLMSTADLNRAQAHYALSILPSAIGLNYANAFNARAQGKLAGAMKELTEKEKEKVNKIIDYLTLQNGNEALQFLINSDKDVVDSRKEAAKQEGRNAKEVVDNLEYENSWLGRSVRGFRDVAVGLGAAIGGAAAAKGAFKKSPKVTPTPNESNTRLDPSKVGDIAPQYW